MALTPEAKRRTVLATALAAVLTVPAEGIRRVAYYDPPGILTVCMGHTGGDIIKGKVYSMAECKALLTRDMQQSVEQVERCVPGLPPNQLAAWSDAVFNLGPALVCDPAHSAAARMLRDGHRLEACGQLGRWNKARIAGVMVELPGLTKRRAAEARLCVTPEPTA